MNRMNILTSDRYPGIFVAKRGFYIALVHNSGIALHNFGDFYTEHTISELNQLAYQSYQERVPNIKLTHMTQDYVDPNLPHFINYNTGFRLYVPLFHEPEHKSSKDEKYFLMAVTGIANLVSGKQTGTLTDELLDLHVNPTSQYTVHGFLEQLTKSED